MPGPVNQVHKPKPLGEVLLLNSSQLLEFFFPLSLLIGESRVFPGSWFARERKKGSKRLLHRRRGALKKCFVISLYILHSSPPPRSLSVCSSQNLFVPLTTVLWEVRRWNTAHVWLWLRGTTTPPLMFRLLGKAVMGGGLQCAMALCAPVKHTCPIFRDSPSEWVQAGGQVRCLSVKDRLACGGKAILVLNLSLQKIPSKTTSQGFCFTFHSFELAGHP